MAASGSLWSRLGDEMSGHLHLLEGDARNPKYRALGRQHLEEIVGKPDLKFASRDVELVRAYLLRHPEVSGLFITGGDPMIMSASNLERYIEPLLDPQLESLQTIRIGTKATAYWPYRFTSDDDADAVLLLFERVQRAGRQLVVVTHYSRPRELLPSAAQEAVCRIRSTGAVIFCQAPVIRRVNDSADIWADLWQAELKLGCVPYYMFIERDTGPKNYFEIPLLCAFNIFRDAYRRVSGVARTVRGPVMSATPGKVIIDGISTIQGERVFVLRFLRARDPDWEGWPFFARFDPSATWFTDLVPAFGDARFFYEERMEQIVREKAGGTLGDVPLATTGKV